MPRRWVASPEAVTVWTRSSPGEVMVTTPFAAVAVSEPVGSWPGAADSTTASGALLMAARLLGSVLPPTDPAATRSTV